MTFNKLIDWKWVNEVKDVFNLKDHQSEWIKKPGFGVASVDKILNSIEEHKKTTLSAFICALGIPLIGQTAARELEKEFKTYEAFRAAVDDSNYYFFSIANFGEEMNDSLKNYDYSAADEIEKILSIQLPVVSNNNIENILSGKTIVITGKLNKFSSRSKLKEEIVNHGGKVTDAVSSRTDILINNDTESSTAKNKKAKSLGIPILSEAEFVEQFLEK
jgi:DNA ligase (NAD+)